MSLKNMTTELIAVIVSFFALIVSFLNFLKKAFGEQKNVDAMQDAKIVKIEGEIKLLQSNQNHIVHDLTKLEEDIKGQLKSLNDKIDILIKKI